MAGTRRRLASCGLGIGAVALALGLGGTVGADTSGSAMSLSFPVTTVLTGQPGSVHEVTSGDVATGMVGQTCSVTATADNNVSVHPGSDLLVASGSTQVVVSGIEATPGGATAGQGTLTLGSKVTVSVQLGSDGVFSGGGSVDLVCAAVSPSTTSATTQPAPSAAQVEATTETSPAVVEAAAVTASPSFTG